MMMKKSRVQPLTMMKQFRVNKKRHISNAFLSSRCKQTTCRVKEGERAVILDLASRGNGHFDAGEYDVAIKIYTAVLRKAAEIKDCQITARILINIGNAHLQRDDLENAMKAFTMALALAKDMLNDISTKDDVDIGHKVQSLALVADALQNVGIVHLESGQFDEALSMNSEALKLRRKCLEYLVEESSEPQETFASLIESKNGTVDQVLVEIAEVLNSIGMCSEREGKYSASIAAYEESLQIRRSVLGPENPDVAISLFNLGGCYAEMAQFDSAMECFENALKMRKQFLGERHIDVADTLNSISGIHLRRGNFESAMRCCRDAVSIASEKPAGLDHVKVAAALNTMGMINERLGNLEVALQSYSEALAVKSKFLGANHPSVASTLHNIGNIYYENEDYDEAMISYLESLKVKETCLGPEHPSAAVTLNNIGTVHCFKEQYDEALFYHERALKIWDLAVGAEKNKHPSIADTLNSIGVALKGKGDTDGAIEKFTSALKIYREAKLPVTHPGVSSAIRNIAEIGKGA